MEEKLMRSEIERNILEAKFQHLVGFYKAEESRAIAQTKEKYAAFTKLCKESDERNKIILKSLQRLENEANAVFSKTERLKQLRNHYDAYLSRAVPLWRHPDVVDLQVTADPRHTGAAWIRTPRTSHQPVVLMAHPTIPASFPRCAAGCTTQMLTRNQCLSLGEAGMRMLRELNLMEGINCPRLSQRPRSHLENVLPVNAVVSKSFGKSRENFESNYKPKFSGMEKIGKDSHEIECLQTDDHQELENLSDDDLDKAILRGGTSLDENPIFRQIEPGSQNSANTAPTSKCLSVAMASSSPDICDKITVSHQKSVQELKAFLSTEDDFAARQSKSAEDCLDEDIPDDFNEQNFPESLNDPRYQNNVLRNVILEEDEEEDEDFQAEELWHLQHAQRHAQQQQQPSQYQILQREEKYPTLNDKSGPVSHPEQRMVTAEGSASPNSDMPHHTQSKYAHQLQQNNSLNFEYMNSRQQFPQMPQVASWQKPIQQPMTSYVHSSTNSTRLREEVGGGGEEGRGVLPLSTKFVENDASNTELDRTMKGGNIFSSTRVQQTQSVNNSWQSPSEHQTVSHCSDRPMGQPYQYPRSSGSVSLFEESREQAPVHLKSSAVINRDQNLGRSNESTVLKFDQQHYEERGRERAAPNHLDYVESIKTYEPDVQLDGQYTQRETSGNGTRTHSIPQNCFEPEFVSDTVQDQQSVNEAPNYNDYSQIPIHDVNETFESDKPEGSKQLLYDHSYSEDRHQPVPKNYSDKILNDRTPSNECVTFIERDRNVSSNNSYVDDQYEPGAVPHESSQYYDYQSNAVAHSNFDSSNGLRLLSPHNNNFALNEENVQNEEPLSPHNMGMENNAYFQESLIQEFKDFPTGPQENGSALYYQSNYQDEKIVYEEPVPVGVAVNSNIYYQQNSVEESNVFDDSISHPPDYNLYNEEYAAEMVNAYGEYIRPEHPGENTVQENFAGYNTYENQPSNSVNTHSQENTVEGIRSNKESADDKSNWLAVGANSEDKPAATQQLSRSPEMTRRPPAANVTSTILNQLLDSESESYQLELAGSQPDDSDFDISLSKQ